MDVQNLWTGEDMNSTQIFAAQDELGGLIKSMNGDQQRRFIVESLSECVGNDEPIFRDALNLCKQYINHENVDLEPMTEAAYTEFRAISKSEGLMSIYPDQPTVYRFRKMYAAYKMCTDMLSNDPYGRAMAAIARNEAAGLSLHHQILIARRIHEMPTLP